MVKCKLENGNKIVNTTNHKIFSALVSELQKALNLSTIQISYTFEEEDYQIENQSDWDTALLILKNNIAINIKSAPQNPTTKTTQLPCRDFQLNGSCKYGTRCKYSHNTKAQATKHEEFEYIPLKNNYAIEAFLVKKIAEKPGPSELSTKLCKLRLEDILG